MRKPFTQEKRVFSDSILKVSTLVFGFTDLHFTVAFSSFSCRRKIKMVSKTIFAFKKIVM